MPSLPTQFINLPDIELAYCEAGSGETLLFLHGNSESKRIFAHYQAHEFADFRTIALDSRGHGQSRSHDLALTIPQLSWDVARFCEAKGIKKTHLVGYSDGGNIALLLAKHTPQLFNRIVAISPNYLVSGTDEKTLKLFTRLSRLWKFLGRLGLPTRKLAMRFDLMLNDIGISAEELRTIQTGMKILYAEQEMIKPDHILEIAELVPDSELEMIPGCTHMNILQHPRTAQSIREYLPD
ncbi:MAG: alpha/beta fold hydrolase [Anaerolineaceae bacterium]|jgi:pimeloyl-ACP methyl ester carboxylesterase